MPDTRFRVVTFNVLGTRFSQTWDQRRNAVLSRLGHVLRRTAPARASVYLLTECGADERSFLKANLPGSYLTWSRGAQTILFDTAKWRHSTVGSMDLGTTDYHGAVWAPLQHLETDRTVVFCAFHLPPKGLVGQRFQKQRFRLLLSALDTFATCVIGGDANNRHAPRWARDFGLVSAIRAPQRVNHDRTTLDPFVVGAPIDHLLGRGISWRSYLNQDAGSASDHQMVTARATAPAA